MQYKKGGIYPSEKIVTKDNKTGINLWQMTNYPANHSNLYYTKSSFTPDSKYIIVLSCRTGYSNLYQISLDSGEILKLTDHKQDIHQLSPCLSSDGEVIYYTLGSSIRSVNWHTLEERVIAEFSDSHPGVLSISKNGSFLITRTNPGRTGIRNDLINTLKYFRNPLRTEIKPFKTTGRILAALASRFRGGNYYLVSISTRNPTQVNYINKFDQGGISLISPDDKHILCHKSEREIWCCEINGKNLRHLYGHGTGKWLTHPNWLSNEEIIVVDWPNALLAINLDGKIRTIDNHNFWHPTVRSDGRLIVCDTMSPDTGIYAVNPINGEKKVLFYPKSSEQLQWRKSKPPRKTTILPFFIKDPFGSQWEHPHQSFSPDGKKIIFNSTRGGKYSQVFIAFL